MSIVFLLLGLLLGSGVAYWLFQDKLYKPLQKKSEVTLQRLQRQHHIELEKLRKEQATQLEQLHERQKEELEQLHTEQMEQLNDAIQTYETQISELKLAQQKAIKTARKDSTNASRGILKGKIAEQLAPILPGFNYLPADARFIGDPIDYIIFNGYTQVKDEGDSGDDLEVIIADIKTGKASLSKQQRAIAKAIKAGRVRFETIRIDQQLPTDRDRPPLEQNETSSLQLTAPPSTAPALTRRLTPPPYETPKHPRAYQPWSTEEDTKLRDAYAQGWSVANLATYLQRKPSAIRSRLKKLGF